MSKKRSIYNATYGRIDEMDRSQGSRDMNFGRAQARYDSMEADYSDFNEEDIYSQAADEAMSHAEQEAAEFGLPNIDALAMQQYGIKATVTPDGRPYSPGEQLIDKYIEMFEEMIRSGEM